MSNSTLIYLLCPIQKYIVISCMYWKYLYVFFYNFVKLCCISDFLSNINISRLTSKNYWQRFQFLQWGHVKNSIIFHKALL